MGSSRLARNSSPSLFRSESTESISRTLISVPLGSSRVLPCWTISAKIRSLTPACFRSTIRAASTVNFEGCAFSRLMTNPSLNPAWTSRSTESEFSGSREGAFLTTAEMILSLTPSFFKSISAEVSLASREPCWSIRFVMKSSLSPDLLSFTRSEFVIVVCALRIPTARTKLVNKSIRDLFMSPF